MKKEFDELTAGYFDKVAMNEMRVTTVRFRLDLLKRLLSEVSGFVEKKNPDGSDFYDESKKCFYRGMVNAIEPVIRDFEEAIQ